MAASGLFGETRKAWGRENTSQEVHSEQENHGIRAEKCRVVGEHATKGLRRNYPLVSSGGSSIPNPKHARKRVLEKGTNSEGAVCRLRKKR